MEEITAVDVYEDALADLESRLDGLTGEHAELEREWDKLSTAVQAAIADLGGLPEVPLGNLEEAIGDVARVLREAWVTK